jgi:hypothetical protein
MFHSAHRSPWLSTPASRVSRRQLLKVGALGFTSLSLPRLLQSRAVAESTGLAPRADACVIIFLNGGPSHLDMWDMKP